MSRAGSADMAGTAQPRESPHCPDGLAAWWTTSPAAGRGVIMTMGKGGVGKTPWRPPSPSRWPGGGTGHAVTTDPAAHVAAAVDGELPPA